MKYRLSSEGAFSLVIVDLKLDEVIKLQSGAMVYHNGEIKLEGKMNSGGGSGLGGIIKALGKSVTSGESVFITKATGKTDNGLIALAPNTIGTIKELDIGKEKWRLNDGAFLACDSTVSYKMKRQSLGKAVLGGTGGLFVMETTGEGTMLINGFGDIVELDVKGDKPFVVDNTHVLAWSSSLNYSIKAASGKLGFMSGEGLVNEFTGTGKILVQTRTLPPASE